MKSPGHLAENWIKFLSEIDEARRLLRCSNSAAWFRGHSDSAWQLKPTLFRGRSESDPDDQPEVRRREAEIQRLGSAWEQIIARKTFLKKRLETYHGAVKSPQRAGQSQNVRENSEEAYHAASAEANVTKAEMAEAKRSLKRFRVPVNGERELFDEFIFRSGKTGFSNSWEIVAEMRHYGVPTRLLDWTDRLDIALYFALEKYRLVINPSMELNEALESVRRLPTPCVWVLNPYLLSKRAAGRTAIWNLALDPTHDYYHLLLRDRKWPYDEPIPTYPPAPIERIRSQRGSFTVFGNRKEPLEAQLQGNLSGIKKIVLTPEAALFCLDYLVRVQGLSEFEIFRDLDSLGRELAQRFFRIQKIR